MRLMWLLANKIQVPLITSSEHTDQAGFFFSILLYFTELDSISNTFTFQGTTMWWWYFKMNFQQTVSSFWNSFEIDRQTIYIYKIKLKNFEIYTYICLWI